MYVINKILNNNVVISVDEQKREIIVMGRGIAFGKKSGDNVEKQAIDKVFVLSNEDNVSEIASFLHQVDEHILDISKELLMEAERQFDFAYTDKTYLTLIDHLNYAVLRKQKGITIPNPLLLDIKKFYPKEFALALQGLEWIEQRMSVHFNEDEAGFIALHLVTNNLNTDNVQTTIRATELVRDILTIIRRFFGLDFDEQSLSYTRMVTHIQYFVQRILADKTYQEEDAFLYELVQAKYPRAYQCSSRVKDYLQQKEGITVENAEMIYLVIHINRVVDETMKEQSERSQ